jgi:hypothetical protein
MPLGQHPDHARRTREVLDRRCHTIPYAQVQRTFLQVAASLAGVTLTKYDLVARTEVVQAQIIDHKQHDPSVNEGKLPEYTRPGMGCTIA